MTTIGKVRIKGIRGIRDELTLDLGGKSLLLRGDNGTGKSSIVQAIRWAVTGKPTGANAEPLPPEVCHHRKDDLSKTRVEIDLLPNGRIVFDGGKVDEQATDAAGGAFIDACVRSTPFLRRDELVGILTDKPGDRFKYLERFLDRERVDALLAALTTRIKGHESTIVDATREKERRLDQLAASGVAPRSLPEVVQRLCTEGRRLGYRTDEKRGMAALVDLRTAIGDTGPNNLASARRAKLGAGIERASTLVPPDHPRSVLEPLEEAERKASESELLELLSEAADIVERRPTLDSCPVCEQPVARDDLASRLRARIAVLDDVRRLGDAAEDLGDQWRTFLSALEDLDQLAHEKERPPTAFRKGRALLERLSEEHGESISSEILARLDTLRTALRSAHEVIPDEVRATDIGALAKAIDGALGTWNAVEVAEARITKHTESLQRLRAVHKAVLDARKDVAEEIHGEIEQLVASFYERIHPPNEPDEVTGAPKIEVRRHGSGTAYLRGTFDKQEIADPRHLYSDGHLDTVGLCIFLALHKKASAGPRLLVLDDIVLSIDLGHASRLVRLIREEFKKHQIVVLSHNPLFMELSRRILYEAETLEIIEWSLEEGPRLASRLVRRVEGLEDALRTCGTPQDLAHAMIRLVDPLFSEACIGLRAHGPMSRDGLSLDDYWSALRSRLAKLQKAGVFPDLAPVIDQIGEPVFFRNVLGAHQTNAWALEAPLSEIRRIVKGVLGLAAQLTCATCRNVVRLKDWRNPPAGLACECESGPSLPSSKKAS